MDMFDIPLTGEVEEYNDFPLLPAGEYEFTVTNAVGAEYRPGPTSKLKRCAQAKLTLTIEGKSTEGKEVSVKVFDNLYADSTNKGAMSKVNAFAKCTAIFFPGMTFGNLIQRAPGMVGACRLKIHEYNGKKSNQVERYLFTEQEKPEIEVTNDDLPF